ncbi:MAG: bifunctional riboflavin kinase/FAD synthetase [Eubacteriales bacterium]|nr:bifunctional riboflavin kinase/FAD synthetase [Eubacteriales bacterium]
MDHSFTQLNKRCIALGFFDGVHLGHAALLNRVKERAAENGLSPAVLTFDMHPDILVHREDLRLITDCDSRKEILSRCFGIEDVIVIPFDVQMMNTSWEDFLSRLIGEYEVSHIVVGYDFTFGAKGAGNAEKLLTWCGDHGIGCDVINPVIIDGVVVSSTLIRELIRKGDMEAAFNFLGHPYCISDTVQPGYQIGRKMAAPTINMRIPEGTVVPAFGVYATKAIFPDGSEFDAVTNIGVRPTFGENNEITVETHILDFSENIYGVTVRVDFYSFIRQEEKFSDCLALSEQIKRDAERARELLKLK